MPQIAGHIFNKKKLGSILKDKHIEDFSCELKSDEITGIIKNWQALVRLGVLDRKNEVTLQDDFLHDFFGKILGYKSMAVSPEEWHYEREKVTIKDASRSDAALGFFGHDRQDDIRVAVELKAAKVNLDRKQARGYSPVEQVFNYTGKFGEECRWAILSNYKEVRLYRSSSMNKYEMFTIDDLAKDDFLLKKFLFLLSKDRLIDKGAESVIEKLYRHNAAEEDKISKEFYSQYREVRYHLFEHLKSKNPSIDEFILLEKTQKILDRFIFICFCEDTNLLPERIFRKALEAVKANGLMVKIGVWDQLRALFQSINEGNPDHKINRYDGGLFAHDDILDGTLILEDEIINELAEITDYDFDSDLNVNILGHIFEQSISDIEEIKTGISDKSANKNTGKRKKEGIYYTPEYITHYIVEQAVGEWLKDRREELGFNYLPELTESDYASIKHLKTKAKITYNKNVKKHLEFWESYKKVLSNIKVLDPACGSGAFLNQTFDFLYKEGQDVNLQIAELQKGQINLFGLDKEILKKNLFGVDLNPESVEITKLSLWLKTADNRSELTALDKNVLCGNSLINDACVVGDKAFNWEENFPEIMKDGGFDVVIGNPPYIPAENIPENQKRYFEKTYMSAFGRLNVYPIFYEKAIQLTKKSGYVGFISPYTLQKNQYYIESRRFILLNTSIRSLVDFKNYKVFEDAVVDSIILILKKDNIEDNKIGIIDNIADFSKHDFRVSFIPQSIIFDNEDLAFCTSSGIKFKDKIYSDTIKIENVIDFDQGIITGNNKIFLTDIPDINTKKVLLGRNFNRYSLNYQNLQIIYDEKKLHRPRRREVFEQKEKILLRQTGSYPICTLDTEQYYTLDTVHNGVVINPNFEIKYVLGLLNSRLLRYLYEQSINECGKVFAQVKIIYINQLPIKDISKEYQAPFVKKVNTILECNKHFSDIANKFVRYLITSYHPKKVTSKLKEFYNTEFGDFILELRKQKVIISKKDEYEFMEIFESEKSKALQIKTQIDQTDLEIDQMVYRLFGLSDEDIKTVENSLFK